MKLMCSLKRPALLIALLISAATEAHEGSVLYPIYELSTAELPDLHDGTLEDWEEALPGPTLTNVDFSTMYGEPLMDLSDLAVAVYLAWHAASQRIYVGVQTLDDYYLLSPIEGYHPGEGLFSDGIRFVVDGDHSGGRLWGPVEARSSGFTEEEMQSFSRQAQSYYAPVERWDGHALGYYGFGAWVTWPPYADAGGVVDEGRGFWGIEMYVTAWDRLDYHTADESVPSVLEGDRIIGFQMSVSDMDEGQGPWATGDIYVLQARTADAFVDGLLVPCDWEDCSRAGSVSAVQADSWGRIKASFR